MLQLGIKLLFWNVSFFFHVPLQDMFNIFLKEPNFNELIMIQ